MKTAINQRNRLVLAYLELSGDKVFQRLSEEQRLHLIEEVQKIGDDLAGEISKECGETDPRKIAEKLGVKVIGEDKGHLRRSEYRGDKKEIVVFRDSLNRLNREVLVPELSERLYRYVVAHELFSHLEKTRLGELSQKYKFMVFNLGPFKVEKSIKGLSNIAAQAFSQTLLQLDLSPRVFDYLIHILYNVS